jgi:hypothetical protein
MYFNNNVFTKDARDYDGLMKGGETGPSVVAGKPAGNVVASV